MPRHVHIIGIGGIGTSALAQWLNRQGLQVEGSDAVASDITNWLNSHGISVSHDPVSGFDQLPELVIYSDSVPPTHPLRQKALADNIPQVSYAAMLGQLTSDYQTIAIAGSHGKSSTTALTGLLYEACGLDPTVVIGTRVPAWHTPTALGNYRPGQGKICIVEADEYKNHFHELNPLIGIITSIDHDHVDSFPTAEDYRQAFEKFIDRVDPNGSIIIEAKAYELMKHKLKDRQCLIYAMPGQTHPAAHITATVPVVKNGRQYFTVTLNNQNHKLSLGVPGSHMVGNFLAALGAAQAYKINAETIITAAQAVTQAFTGTWRRFEAIGTFQAARAFSDYAHHPTEIAALIKAAHQFYPENRLVLVLQPHHHNRARAFAGEFKQVIKETLRASDKIIFCEVYGVPGRENQADTVTTKDWAKGFNSLFVPTLDQLADTLKPIIQPGDILIFAGAGDIDAAARKIAH